jgi:hypothetical protein
VLFGVDGRMTEAEGVLTKDACSVLDLVERLEAMDEVLRKQMQREAAGDEDEDMDGSENDSEEEEEDE